MSKLTTMASPFLPPGAETSDELFTIQFSLSYLLLTNNQTLRAFHIYVIKKIYF